MWNDPLITPMPKTRPPVPKTPPAKPSRVKPKKKPKAKAKPKVPAKISKDIAELKALTKTQGETLARLSEIVSSIKLSNADHYAE